MKTIEIQVYSFNELSKEAKEVAINNYRSQGVETNFIYDDSYKTIKKQTSFLIFQKVETAG